MKGILMCDVLTQFLVDLLKQMCQDAAKSMEKVKIGGRENA